jgi:hypothetical protein
MLAATEGPGSEYRPRPRYVTRPAATFLHKVTDPYIYGIKRLDVPQAFAKITTLQNQLNERNYGYRWNQASFLEHCKGNKTLY